MSSVIDIRSTLSIFWATVANLSKKVYTVHIPYKERRP